jgi:hypothetical protein
MAEDANRNPNPPSRAAPGSEVASIDEMRAALKAAKWWEAFAHVWRSPDGRLYRGPAMAYHIMMGLPWPPNEKGQARRD